MFKEKKNYKYEFEKSRNTATRSDLEKVLANSDKISRKFQLNSKLIEFFYEFKAMKSMLKDYKDGAYKEIPWATIAAVVGTLIYVLSPIDTIPDFIPGIGYIDDAGVVLMCLNFIGADLEDYKNWKGNIV